MEVYDFGLRLKELREAKRLSQTEVAKRLSVGCSTISGYESNTITPSLEQFTRLAILYDTSLDYMMSLDNRTCFYLDGLSKSQQQTILDVVNRLKQSYLSFENPNHYFLTGKTKPTEPRTYRQFFTRFLKKHELQKVKFHEIRHPNVKPKTKSF